jgi:hypothetical protein
VSGLFGVVDDDQDEAPPEAKRTWQEFVWDALAKPRYLNDLRRLALSNGGTEPAASRYLKACLAGGTVVVVGGRKGNARYQRVDQAGDGVGRVPTWAKPLADARRDTRPAVVEAEEGPLDDEADDATGALVRVGRGRYVLPGKATTRPSPAPKAKPAKPAKPAKAARAPRKPAAAPALAGAHRDEETGLTFDGALDRLLVAKAAFEHAKATVARIVAAGGAS